jgi:hypothetical protein
MCRSYVYSAAKKIACLPEIAKEELGRGKTKTGQWKLSGSKMVKVNG